MKLFTTERGLFNLGSRECDISYDEFHWAFDENDVDIKACDISGLRVALNTPKHLGVMSLNVTAHLTEEEIEDIKWLIVSHERGYL